MLTKLIATKFSERSQSLGYKGKKRDDACLDFWAGAATMAVEAKHPEAQAVVNTAVLVIAVRGFLANQEIALK
jgi:hypothetical protein